MKCLHPIQVTNHFHPTLLNHYHYPCHVMPCLISTIHQVTCYLPSILDSILEILAIVFKILFFKSMCQPSMAWSIHPKLLTLLFALYFMLLLHP
jgi:hypothetical protein